MSPSEKEMTLFPLFPQVAKVTYIEGGSPVKFSLETSFVVDKFEIL